MTCASNLTKSDLYIRRSTSILFHLWKKFILLFVGWWLTLKLKMEEVVHSSPLSNDNEKGQQTPLGEPTDGSQLSYVNNGKPLPPMDSGMNAWLFLAACFVMEALVWGFAFTYGVFQAYYTEIPEFKDTGNIAVVGTCAMVRNSYISLSDK
jgi:hypothetical protein